MVPLASLHANCIERLIKHRRRGHVVRNIRGKISRASTVSTVSRASMVSRASTVSRVSTVAADAMAATPSKARMVKRMAEVGKLV